MFLFNSMMLSSTERVDVFIIVCVPSTVRLPFTLISPTDGSSSLPVSPSSVINVVVSPPSLTVKMMSLSAVVFAIVRLSLDIVMVMSLPLPILIPSSVCIDNLPVVVSAVSDLK